MALVRSSEDLIGNTPLLEARNYSKQFNPDATLLVKLEGWNPAGSAKDRVAASILADAEATGKLQPGGTIIEPTSGNTGIGIAALATTKGYHAVIVMPDTMSQERRTLVSAYGAELVLTPGAEGMAGAIAKAEELRDSIPGAIIAGQFTNPANPKAHYETTGPEIWKDTEGKVDIFVAGIGTGGTLSGVGKYLKEQNSDVKIIGVEPASSPLLTKGTAGPHKIQGIGANFVPETYDPSVCDELLTVENEAAFEKARAFAAAEGILIGISAGAALAAGTEVANRPENAGKTIVVLLPDTGDRYLSTELYQKQ